MTPGRGMQRDGRTWVAAAILAASVLNATARTTLVAPVAAQTSDSAQLSNDILTISRGPGVQHGAWGIAVQSLDRGERLFELNPQMLLVPASTAKLITAATGAAAVGWDFRFQTTMSIGGTVGGPDDGADGLGTLRGDVLVSGFGDPSIGGRAGDDLTAFVDALRSRGITRIDGRIIGDDDAIEEPRPSLAWAWDDLGYTTGALFGALNLNENRTSVTIAPGAAGQPAQLTGEPFLIGRPLINRVVTGPTGSRQELWPEQRPGETALTIAGSIPAGARAATLSIAVGNPTLWFASALRYKLITSGIPVTGAAVDIDDLESSLDRSSFSPVYTHRSRPLSEIVRPMLKDSINLYAEAVMRLNAAPPGLPTNDAALDGLHQRMAAWSIPATGAQLVDGSGLSRRDVVNANTLLLVLQRMWDPTLASAWMQALPLAGVDGSLQNRMRGTSAERNVRAKTGTMSNVRSLAGYVTTRDGEHLAFAVLLNNFEGTSSEATQALDAIAVHLAGFSRHPRP